MNQRATVIAASRAVGSEEVGIDFAALWRIIWSYKLLIGSVTLLCGLLTVWLALTSATVYRAEVSVAEVSNTGGLGGAGQLASQLGGIASLVGVNLSSLGGSSSREAQGLLKSNRLIEEFVKRHNGLPELMKSSKARPTLWRTVRRFKENVLTVREDKRMQLTIVAITWTDPAVAARWANEFVALCNELMRVRAMEEARASTAYLERQIDLANSVDLKRVLYNLVENETKTLVLANARPEYSFTVIDPAVAPEEKFGPHRALMTLAGLALGAIIGTLIAFAHNSWSRSRRLAPLTANV
jgi:uncharacterized protein involved in exopolysaccharide biosynthesis